MVCTGRSQWATNCRPRCGALPDAALSDARNNRDQVVGVAQSAFGAQPDVVNIEVDGIPATGDSAAPVVALQHRSA